MKGRSRQDKRPRGVPQILDVQAWRGCSRKMGFLTLRVAEKRAGEINAHDDSSRMYAYKCRFCKVFHLTHVKPQRVHGTPDPGAFDVIEEQV